MPLSCNFLFPLRHKGKKETGCGHDVLFIPEDSLIPTSRPGDVCIQPVPCLAEEIGNGCM